jgi:ABC-2 type transport system ATP-binding protein
MGAASYIGRIGGLAVALGVGTAIITGQGVAYATTDGGSQDSGSQSGSSQTGDSQSGSSQESDSQSRDSQSGSSQTGGDTNTNAGTATSDPGTAEDNNSGAAETDGRHLATETTSGSVRATTIIRRFSDAADATVKRLADAVHDAADATNSVRTSSPETRRSGGSSSQTEGAAEPTSAPGSSDTDDATAADNVVANEFVNSAPTIKEWLASPRVAAGRAGDTVSTEFITTPLWTPPRFLTGGGPLTTMTATPTSTTVLAPNLLAALLGDVFNPFAGNSPNTPTPDSPLSWMLVGVSRRQLGVDSISSQSLLAPADSITYAPVVEMVNGVMTYDNPDPPTGFTYTLVQDPSGGGKLLLDPTTGNFSFLPDFSSVQTGTSEDFSVLVAETTPFSEALQGIPLVGPRVLVVLHQVQILSDVLAPIIGESEVVVVTVPVGTLAPPGTPVAFTVMIPSPVDGALISTNYFPAITVVNDPTTTAPTILNGPGIATPGNTDPNSTAIIPNPPPGIVPGLQPLRDAGYNVVTWDPRGEFASGGILNIDSPAFEGQDVKGIIDWISDPAHVAYTFPAFDAGGANPAAVENDPAIGMVGGSYGGAIQLVTAGIDPRVDVIVPGIAWNSLVDSLYPNQTFKTSYASLLLLGLVSTGARINPALYPAFLLGTLVGILTPGQQALLASSGPYFLTANIDVPTLFIQGIDDGLFPLQQSLNNASSIVTPDDLIKMIWYCGGHGACLTMTPTEIAEQDQMLINTTIDEINSVLQPNVSSEPIPKLQFVDQNGQWYTADFIPTDAEFYSGSTPVVTDNGAGGLLGIVPLLGGSGPQSVVPLPGSLALGSEAKNAIDVPLDDGAVGTTVVGAPQLTFDYTGVGTSRSVYAQIVDRNTGLVVGNIVTPIPVTLNGRPQSVTIDMADIVYTYDDVPNDADLELQIVGSATQFLNLTQFGFINISNVEVSLPTPGSGAGVTPETLDPVMV